MKVTCTAHSLNTLEAKKYLRWTSSRYCGKSVRRFNKLMDTTLSTAISNLKMCWSTIKVFSSCRTSDWRRTLKKKYLILQGVSEPKATWHPRSFEATLNIRLHMTFGLLPVLPMMPASSTQHLGASRNEKVRMNSPLKPVKYKVEMPEFLVATLPNYRICSMKCSIRNIRADQRQSKS